MTQPQDVTAEAAVVGAAFLAPSTIGTAEEAGLRPEDFYRDSHRAIWEAILKLDESGEPIDPITVSDMLERRGALTLVGGRAGVEILSGAVPYIGNIRGYAAVVHRKAILRRRLNAAYEQITAIEEDDDQAWAVAVADADHADDAKRAASGDLYDQFVAWYQSPRGWDTPYPQLTQAIAGFQPGDMTVISAWPGVGKSILVDSFVEHAHSNGARCHIYVNEMSEMSRLARTVARLTGVAWQDLRDRTLDSRGWQRVTALLQEEGNIPARYTGIAGESVETICRSLVRNRWDVAVIDTATRIPYRDTRDLERVSGMLADAARKTETHLFLLVQMNMERAKGATWPMPVTRDLLGGGMWNRDARNIIFVHRAQEEGGDGQAVQTDEGYVYATKATHGDPSQSAVPVTFVASQMRFVERYDDSSSQGIVHYG